ncbi:hypothetical protein EMCRGX_G006919 [Ephydatia muelleri]
MLLKRMRNQGMHQFFLQEPQNWVGQVEYLSHCRNLTSLPHRNNPTGIHGYQLGMIEAGMGHMLNPEDVDSLFGIVKGAKAKWRDIGRELGFTLKEMDEIVQKKGISQDQDYFQELLDLWLNWAPPQRPFPCTEDLLDALRRIGQHRLALTLENTEIIMGMKTLVTRGLQLNPTFTTVSGITAANKPPTAPGNGLVAIATDSPHTGIKAPSEPPKEPRNGSVPIVSDLPPTEDTGLQKDIAKVKHRNEHNAKTFKNVAQQYPVLLMDAQQAADKFEGAFARLGACHSIYDQCFVTDEQCGELAIVSFKNYF